MKVNRNLPKACSGYVVFKGFIFLIPIQTMMSSLSVRHAHLNGKEYQYNSIMSKMSRHSCQAALIKGFVRVPDHCATGPQ